MSVRWRSGLRSSNACTRLPTDRSPIVRRVAANVLVSELRGLGSLALPFARRLAVDVSPKVAERAIFVLMQFGADYEYADRQENVCTDLRTRHLSPAVAANRQPSSWSVAELNRQRPESIASIGVLAQAKTLEQLGKDIARAKQRIAKRQERLVAMIDRPTTDPVYRKSFDSLRF